MQPDILKNFIEPLAVVYGRKPNAEALATQLVEHLPAGTTDEQLRALAKRMIETRRGASSPVMAELIKAVRAIPSLAKRDGAPKHQPKPEESWEESQARAIRLLRSMYQPLAERAIREGWHLGLIQFTVDNGRAPGLDEEAPLIRRAQRINANIRNAGTFKRGLAKLANGMRAAAASRLRGEDKVEEEEGQTWEEVTQEKAA